VIANEGLPACFLLAKAGRKELAVCKGRACQEGAPDKRSAMLEARLRREEAIERRVR
jgi:hypothetical protein